MIKNQSLGALAIGMCVVAVAAIAWQLMPESTVAGGTAFFTTDDGATYFAGDENQLAPFDHNSSTAVRAHVYLDPMTGKPFVAYLSRYTESGRKQMAAAMAGAKAAEAAQREGHVAVAPEVQFGSADLIEVKAPGAGAKWTSSSSPDGLRISNPTAPDGTPLEAAIP
jgi:hypothetical protein